MFESRDAEAFLASCEKTGQIADWGISRVGDIVDIKANGAVQKG